MSSTHTIPRTQRASILPFAGGDLKLVENHPVPDPAQLKPGQCLVKLTHSGVCHTDLSIKTFSTPSMVKEELIGGHEGVGIVVAIADHTSYDGVRLGDRVGVKFMANSCLKCEACLKGFENLCRSLQKSGVNIDGTFCEYVMAYVTHVTPIPDALESPAAAAIMCAGISAYSALMQSNTRIGDWVVIRHSSRSDPFHPIRDGQ